MAFFIRSVECKVENQSEHELRLVHQELEWGSFDAEPPPVIPSGGTGAWRSSTDGFMTGTEGFVRFEVGSTGAQFEVYWNNPFIGENEFTQSCSGLATYVPVEPSGTSPESGDLLDAAGLQGDDDVVVTYVLRTSEASEVGGQGECEAEELDSPVDNRDPKPTKTNGVDHVLVCDADVRYRKLVYWGLNPIQSDAEATALRRGAPALLPAPGCMPCVRTVTTTDIDGLERIRETRNWIEPWLTALGLQVGQRKALKTLLQSFPAGEGPRPELLAFIQVLAEVEVELAIGGKLADRPTGGKNAPMKRLIISGHHWNEPPGTGVIYGDGGAVCHLASPPGSTPSSTAEKTDLALLAPIFSRAFAQVEDLCLSACNTGHHETSPAPSMKMLHLVAPYFPNLQTIWAHEAKAPSGQPAVVEVTEWEKASRDSNAKVPLVDLAYHRRFQFPNFDWDGKRVKGFGRPIVWARSGDGVEPIVMYSYKRPDVS
jgi:hypothetical protein